MKDLKDLEAKVALVTGGTGGIGRATAIEFGRRGASVVVTGRRETEGCRTVDLIREAGAEAAFCQTDISKEADCKKMVDFTLDKFGRLDFAFNNAGTEGTPAQLTEDTEENFHKIMNTNVLGVMLSLKYEAPAIIKSGGGAIVNNASVAGSIGMPGVGTYIASKHAVIGYTKTAALEWSAQGLRVNSVSPAAIETDMLARFAPGDEGKAQMAQLHPIGRVGKPQEIATAVTFLCSEGASFITGHDLKVDGAFTTP